MLPPLTQIVSSHSSIGPVQVKLFGIITITWNLSRCDDERLTFRVPDSGETVPVRLLFQSCYIPVIFIVRNYKTISQINLLFQDRVWGIYELKKLHKCL